MMPLKAIKIFEELKDGHLLEERYEMGLLLGITEFDLKAIELDNPNNSKKQMIDIFSTWLRSDLEASWKKLQATMLKMGYDVIARRLQTKVDEESACSLREVVEQRNAKIDAHNHDIEEKRIELEGQHDDELPEELNESNIDEHASILQTKVEEAESDGQWLRERQQENEKMQQEVDKENQEAKNIKYRTEERAHHLTSEKEKNILDGFDVILQQLDSITHDLNIKKSTAANHQTRMKELDTMTDKLSAIDEQLKDCNTILTIVDNCLQTYRKQIVDLSNQQEKFDYLLGLNKLNFDKHISSLKEFNSRVESWQSDVKQRSSELQRKSSVIWKIAKELYNNATTTMGGVTGVVGGVVGGAVGGAMGGAMAGTMEAAHTMVGGMASVHVFERAIVGEIGAMGGETIGGIGGEVGTTVGRSVGRTVGRIGGAVARTIGGAGVAMGRAVGESAGAVIGRRDAGGAVGELVGGAVGASAGTVGGAVAGPVGAVGTTVGRAVQTAYQGFWNYWTGADTTNSPTGAGSTSSLTETTASHSDTHSSAQVQGERELDAVKKQLKINERIIIKCDQVSQRCQYLLSKYPQYAST